MTPTFTAAAEKSCSNCGAAFTCGPMNGEEACWCNELPHISPPPGVAQDCLCPTCLREAIPDLDAPPTAEESPDSVAQSDGSYQSSIIDGGDYYFEGGLMVFTANYHMRRGFCCRSGCRHCPYGL